MVDTSPAPPSGESLRVVFFGTPQFAVPSLTRLLGSRHQVCGVVTQPDRPRGRGQKVRDAPVKASALTHGLPVFQPDRLRDPIVEETVRSWRPDLGVVAAYGKLIPESLLSLPRHGMINVHASLLPRYRGAAPVHRAIIDGERETGVTIMRVVRLLDAGGMFAKARRPIGSDETSEQVERDLAEVGAALLLDVIEQIASGTAREEPQDDMLSTYAPRLSKEEGLVDWSLPASYIHNRVRGLYPWPHAYTYIGGERLILLATRVHEPGAADRRDAAPGTVLAVARDALEVATGHHGTVAILEVQPEGRRPMKIGEYLAGHPIPAGGRFGSR